MPYVFAVIPATCMAHLPGQVSQASPASMAAGRDTPESVAAAQAADDALEQLAEDAPDDVADASDDLSEDVDRWVLHDVLAPDGRAQTQDWRDALDAVRLLPQRKDRPAWQQDLERARLTGALRGTPEQHHEIDTSKLAFDIPLQSHPLVDMYIDYFTGRGRLMFERWLIRAERYRPLMQSILAQKNVPQDLVYVAMIESGFSAHAYSSAAASGYWQFMRATGKLYGLHQDHWVDERRDFIKATQAAATYMSQLHRTLGDWHLAWASYNAGEGRVRRALGKYQEKTFWALIEHHNSLAKETMHYVPKVIAAALVAKDAKRYGFDIAPQAPLSFEEISVEGAVDLHVLAKASKLEVQDLTELNPALLHAITPPGQTTRLRVPTGRAPVVSAALKRIPTNHRLTYYTHRVQPGDTLTGIAQRFATDLTTLRAFNRLQGPVLRVGQQIIVPISGNKPLAVLAQAPQALKRPAVRPVAVRSRARANKPRYLRQGSQRHVVRAGETLWGIAHHYHVSLDRIRTHRKANRLAVGDVLEIM